MGLYLESHGSNLFVEQSYCSTVEEVSLARLDLVPRSHGRTQDGPQCMVAD